MELMPEPMALPGCCFKCRAGSNNRDFFIDLQFNFDFHGAVYICNECILEMAHAAGYIAPDEAHQLKEKALILLEEKATLLEKIFGLEQAIDGLRIAGRSVGAVPERHDSAPVSSDAEAEPEGTGELVEGERVSPEQVHDEGVAELSDDDSINSDFTFTL